MPRTKESVLHAKARHAEKAEKAPRKRRRRPRTVARREIKKYRYDEKHATKHLIPKTRIERLVREITAEFDTGVRYKRDAVEILHRAAEDFLTDLFTKASRTAWHSRREMTMLKDIDLVRWLGGEISDYPKPRGAPPGSVTLGTEDEGVY